MAYYLVRAQPKADHLAELGQLLAQGAFQNLRPFGEALSMGLNNARWEADGIAIWEEEDTTADSENSRLEEGQICCFLNLL